jgi:hypothetical protein
LLRGGEVEAHGASGGADASERRPYQLKSVGWRLVNFVLVRGSAIIGATVSRHVA